MTTLTHNRNEQVMNQRPGVDSSSTLEVENPRSRGTPMMRWIIGDESSSLSRTPLHLNNPWQFDAAEELDHVIVSIEQEMVIIRTLLQEFAPEMRPRLLADHSVLHPISNWATASEHFGLPMTTGANAFKQVVALLRSFGRGEIADRVIQLKALVDDDAEQPSIDTDSLRAVAKFLLSERHLPDPEIGISPDGLVQAEWYIGTSGIVALEFLPAQLIRFAAIAFSKLPGDVERLRVNGILAKEDALKAVDPFISQV